MHEPSGNDETDDIEDNDLDARENLDGIAAEGSGDQAFDWLNDDAESAGPSSFVTPHPDLDLFRDQFLAEINKKTSTHSPNARVVENVVKNSDRLLPRPTVGGGDCLIHAAFGSWEREQKQFLCSDVGEKRRIMAKSIRECKSGHPLFSLIGDAIQAIIMGEERISAPAITQAQISWKKYCLTEPALVNEAWRVFESELKKHHEILIYIEKFIDDYTKRRMCNSKSTRLDIKSFDLKNRFATCLNEDEGVLRCMIASEDELRKAFATYTVACSQKFNWNDLYLQHNLIDEYASFVERPGNWLLAFELEMMAVVFGITINYYIKQGSVKHINPDSPKYYRTCNPGKINSVSICFNGRDHYEKMATPDELEAASFRPVQLVSIDHHAGTHSRLLQRRQPAPAKILRPPSHIERNHVIEINQFKHIVAIKFYREKQDQSRGAVPMVLAHTRSWDRIPPFAIVTGVNGSGKSRLLEYIYENLINRSLQHDRENLQEGRSFLAENEVVYIKITDNLDQISSGDARTDTSYLISEKFDEVLHELREHYFSGKQRTITKFSKPVYELIDKEINASAVTFPQINEQYLREVIYRTIDYEANNLRITQPFAFLVYVIHQYEKRKQALSNRASQVTFALDLYRFYSELSEVVLNEINIECASRNKSKLNLEDFLERIASEASFRNEIISQFADLKAGPSPLQELNRLLHKYNFKYRAETTSDNSSRDVQLIFKRDKHQVMANELSSGERMIICVMVWQYYAQGLRSDNEMGVRQLDNKAKVMLLDEPDRHLDPRLCKLFYEIIYDEFVKQQNIQVIMTTHRFDTVALAPASNIFLIRHETDASMILPVTKLHAMFRMSRNVRELMDYHHKVYTESALDAKFYEGVYHSLKALCALIRLLRSNEQYKNHHWKLNMGVLPPQSRRLLSDRYQLSFYSVSEKDKKGNRNDSGGCTKVISSIKRDLTALENLSEGKSTSRTQLTERWLRTRNILTDKRLYYPYGVLDNDYEKKYKLKEENIDELVVILSRRHSIENYLFDPIIFCSMLADDEIKNCVLRSKINFADEAEEEQEDEATFISICDSIKNHLARNNYLLLQECLNIFFHIIFKTMIVYYKHRPKNEIKPEEVPIYRNIRNKVRNKLNLCDTPVAFIDRGGNTFHLLYPQEFLIVRGHDIEEFFWYEYNPFKPAELVASKVHENELQFIPLDLADVFFALNDKVRANVLPVIKPELISMAAAPAFFSQPLVRSTSCSDLHKEAKGKESNSSEAAKALRLSL